MRLSQRAFRNGFSLIELLVVIAIIAIPRNVPAGLEQCEGQSSRRSLPIQPEATGSRV